MNSRHKYVFLVTVMLLAMLRLSAQIPNGYYNAAEGKGGSELKTALHNIIKGHTDKEYSGLWETYATSDTIIIGGNTYIYDIYSIRADRTANYFYTVGTDQCGNYKEEGDCYNREHIVPQSWFSKKAPMVSDAHHITPTDGKVNGIRADFPHAEVASATETTSNGSRKGSCATAGYTGTVFEPIDEYKGDVARMYLYMATRYEDNISTWTGEVMDGTAFPAYKPWYIDMLLRWHKQDAVSDKERWRNEAIYARQGNRNPFIDRPEFAQQIWDSTYIPPVDTLPNPPVQPTFADAIVSSRPTVSPNPTNGAVRIDLPQSTMRYRVLSITGRLVEQGVAHSVLQIDLSQQPSGVYVVSLLGNSENISLKVVRL